MFSLLSVLMRSGHIILSLFVNELLLLVMMLMVFKFRQN